ncbi:recombinase family protein [Gemmatimonas sp.]|uniref:recombinase family protein n=1 Tax=Gemmatimonas sp. TaxID=1962908 RepID=UPI00286CEBAE|nr:recombinase family protein [Gemmatimonas sp.]
MSTRHRANDGLQLTYAPAGSRLAFSYARQSEEFPDGIRRQHEENARVAAGLGFTIPDTPEFRYSDDETSGKLKSRDAFNRMLERVTSESKPACALFIRERSRIGRWNDPRRHDYYAVYFADRGVPIVESCDPQWVDWDNDTSDEVTLRFLHSTLKSIQSRNERIEIVRRINRGTRAHIKQGFFSLKAPYYATDRWVAWAHTREPILKLDPGVSYEREGCAIILRWATDGSVQVVRDIFGWILTGRSLGWIAAELTRRHVPPPGARYNRVRINGPWRKELVRNIARNPIYRGDLLYGRTSKRFRGQEAVLAPHAHNDAFGKILYVDFLLNPPLSRGDFDAVQERLDQNVCQHEARSRKKREYPLSGLVTCASCRRALTGFCSPPTRVGHVRVYYRHSKTRGEGRTCPHENRYILAEPVEAALKSIVYDALSVDRLQHLIASEVTRYLDDPRRRGRAEERRASDAELRELGRELERLSEELGQCTQAHWERSLRARKDRIVSKLDALEAVCVTLAQDDARLAAIERGLAHQETYPATLHTLYGQATALVQRRVHEGLIEAVHVDFVAQHVTFFARTSAMDAEADRLQSAGVSAEMKLHRAGVTPADWTDGRPWFDLRGSPSEDLCAARRTDGSAPSSSSGS